MDSFAYHLYIHQSSNSSSASHSSSALTNFPIIAIAVIGILATAFLLVSYYIIVIKCCLNLQRVSVNQDSDNISIMMLSPARLQQRQLKCGLEQSVINSIPIIEFKKSETGTLEPECSVCLGEFRVDEKLRCLQDCNHLFHMDCIDVWLQNNANCPLCRTSISHTRRPPRQDLTKAGTTTCVDSNFAVTEIQPQQLEEPPSHVLPKPEQRDTPKKLKWMEHQQMLSMGDECIDIRSIKDDVFKIQPIRRSISMDSSNDPHLYSMVQDDLLRHHQKKSSIVTSDHHQGCTSSGSIGSSSSRFKRSFFSIGSGRGCKSSSAVLPTHVILPY